MADSTSPADSTAPTDAAGPQTPATNDTSPQKIFFYLAYGSNMCPTNLVAKNVAVISSRPAILRDYRLAFNLHVKGALVEPAFANVVAQPGSAVHGVLHEMSEEYLAMLDKLEMSYKRHHASMELYTGEMVEGSFYIVETLPPEMADMVTIEEHPPSKRYLQILINGATTHKLDPEYIRFLEQQPFTPPLSLTVTAEDTEKIMKRLWTVEEVFALQDLEVSAAPFAVELKGIVFDVSAVTPYRRWMKGKDVTLDFGRRVSAGAPVETISDFRDAHKETVNATVAEWLIKMPILGHVSTFTDGTYTW